MTRTRTISGIPDELWEKAEKKYGERKVSRNIKRLLKKDLGDETVKQEKKPILAESNLLDRQKQIIRDLAEAEIKEFNSQQWRSFLDSYYSRKDYKKKADTDISCCDYTPYHISLGSLETEEFDCPCGARQTLAAYIKNNECVQCGRVL